MLEDFYWPFHASVEETLASADRPTRERELGKDPKSGRTLITRMTRLGPVVQIGLPEELEETEKPSYANLRAGQSIDTINFDEALKLFELPKVLGVYQDMEITVGTGRYGPYVKYGEKYASLPRGVEPLDVDFDMAVACVAEKERADAPVGTFQGMGITKGVGRFGPFIKWNGLFINVPKKYELDTISTNEMIELIQAKLEKESNRYVQQWAEENLAIENGRWGPFIRFKKEVINLPKLDGKKMTSEDAAEMTLEEVKKLVEEAIPDAFQKKAKAPAKKAAATGAKKAPAKRKTTTTAKKAPAKKK
jgi:DNA topoisomerase-1